MTMTLPILVIDDDPGLCSSLRLLLEREGCQVEARHTLEDGREALATLEPAVVVLDLGLPDGSGLDLLRELDPTVLASVAFVVISGQQDMMATIEAIRLGAFDYIRKPLDRDSLLLTVEKIRHRKADVGHVVPIAEVDLGPLEIVGSSPAVLDVIKQVGRLAASPVTVLIQGETGTGKELAARAIHRASSPDAPFVAINCAAVVDTLLESELFGHEAGAFTGAQEARIGKLEQAGDGVIFLDEVGDMSLELQASLLRALEQRSFEPVGGNRSIPLRARVIAATHHDLQVRVSEGAFREDLYFRLAVARLHMPPLRERREDIPQLVQHLLARIGSQLGRELRGISRPVLTRLAAFDWPGNVRELVNALTEAIASSATDVVTDVPIGVVDTTAPASGTSLSLDEAMKHHICAVLSQLDWNISKTARALGISPTTLRKKVTDYGLERPLKSDG